MIDWEVVQSRVEIKWNEIKTIVRIEVNEEISILKRTLLIRSVKNQLWNWEIKIRVNIKVIRRII